MAGQQVFLQIRMLKNFLAAVQTEKTKLVDELVDNATDPVLRKRRLRMIGQLSSYEAQVIEKISNLQTTDSKDFLKKHFEDELKIVVDRNA